MVDIHDIDRAVLYEMEIDLFVQFSVAETVKICSTMQKSNYIERD